MSDFTSSLALSLLESIEEYPVDFDRAIEWWDCKTQAGKPVRRDNLLKKLRDNFKEGRDYHLLEFQEMVDRPQGGGKNAHKAYLTVDCFKSFGMMVSGKRGQEIRDYFLDCEKQVKRSQDIQNAIADRIVALLDAKIESRFAAMEAKLEQALEGKSKPQPQLLSNEKRTEAKRKRERDEIYNFLRQWN